MLKEKTKEINLKEGWYLCARDDKELEMYYDGNKWHLSAYDKHDVVHRRIAKDPDKILKRISHSPEVVLRRMSSWESN